MDPYLERHWLDVHTRLITYAADSLNERLPRGLVASTEERVAIEADDDRTYRAGPDVRVVSRADVAAEPTGGAVILDAPYTLMLELDPVTERFIRILDTDGERLITVIECLSPGNKSGDGLGEYRRKRAQLLAGGVHLVEVDLIRRGDWRRLLRPYMCPAEAVTPCRAIVYTGGASRRAYLYPASLRDALPTVPVPLRPQDKPAVLPLQALVEQVYGRGRYEERLDYSRPCDPPLNDGDDAWADALLKSAGKRPGSAG